MLWKFIAGVALVAASVRTYFYAEPWFRTAGPTAVDEPLSLSPGHVTAKFLAGYNARYRMGIGFAAPQELRFEKPNWLPLPYYPPNDGSGIPTSLKIPWKLSSRGQLIEQ